VGNDMISAPTQPLYQALHLDQCLRTLPAPALHPQIILQRLTDLVGRSTRYIVKRVFKRSLTKNGRFGLHIVTRVNGPHSGPYAPGYASRRVRCADRWPRKV